MTAGELPTTAFQRRMVSCITTYLLLQFVLRVLVFFVQPRSSGSVVGRFVRTCIFWPLLVWAYLTQFRIENGTNYYCFNESAPSRH